VAVSGPLLVYAFLAASYRPTPAALTVDDMVLLRGDLKALQQGQEELDALFPVRLLEKPKEAAPEGEAPSAGPPEPSTDVKAALRQRARSRQAQAPEPPAETPAERQPGEEG
jgi:hypothetical protein